MDRQRATSASEAVTTRVLFAGWLRAGRMARGMSIADVARTTKIQLRTLDHLESGRFESLPADVFVRGFVRNYARCVGLDGDEAVRRYSECNATPVDAVARPPVGPVVAPLITAQALIDSMAPMTSNSVQSVSVPVPDPEPDPPEVTVAAIEAPVADGSGQPKRKRKRKGKGTRRRMARGTNPMQSVDEAGDPVAEIGDAIAEAAAVAEPVAVADAVTETVTVTETIAVAEPVAVTETVDAVEPPRATLVIPPRPIAIRPAPISLTIDDDDPDHAERVQEERGELSANARRSFLPPILRDNLEADRARHGGLTLAVIILLVAATLTLSYLMRRPSSSGEGVTAVPTRSLDVA